MRFGFIGSGRTASRALCLQAHVYRASLTTGKRMARKRFQEIRSEGDGSGLVCHHLLHDHADSS